MTPKNSLLTQQTAHAPPQSLSDYLSQTDASNAPFRGGDGAILGRSPIVSSAHLVSEHSAQMSELEFGLIVAGNAFERWIVHCMAAAGLKDLTPMEVIVLHHVSHRARNKRLSDICFLMNVEDTHLVNYALKKLMGLGVVASHKNGKEVTYAATDKGAEYVQRYRAVREQCLMEPIGCDLSFNHDIGELARLLRVLSGMYDQAARSAASL